MSKTTRHSYRISATCADGRVRAFYARAESGAEAAALLMAAADVARLGASAEDVAEFPVAVVAVQRETRP